MSPGVELASSAEHVLGTVPDGIGTTGVTAGPHQVVALAMSYRVAVLNELQVLLGWAQLGNTERIVEFIASLRDVYHAENELCRWADPDTAGLLLLRRVVAEACRTEIRFALDAPGPFRIPAAARGTVADLLDACLGWSGASRAGAPLLVAAASDQWSASLTCLFAPGTNPSLPEVAAALASLRGGGVELARSLERFQELGGEFGPVRRGGRDGRYGFLLRWPHPPEECL